MKSFEVSSTNDQPNNASVEASSSEPLQLKQTARWWDRLIGLLQHDGLDPNQALWIKPCCIVHTFGMRFALSLHFLDRQGQIVHSEPNVVPNQIRWCFKAHSVVEMVATTNDEALEFQKQRLSKALSLSTV
ncbi:DUF192 domain-containing protein [Orrella sp. 11846]|uniref:DUF192 domain-containing protein n=1 Tax=Orrella sp. 11846 TaxID=3409913 RepID=UPI003B5A8C01